MIPYIRVKIEDSSYLVYTNIAHTEFYIKHDNKTLNMYPMQLELYLHTLDWEYVNGVYAWYDIKFINHEYTSYHVLIPYYTSDTPSEFWNDALNLMRERGKTIKSFKVHNIEFMQ
jgi:hypothetical protein